MVDRHAVSSMHMQQQQIVNTMLKSYCCPTENCPAAGHEQRVICSDLRLGRAQIYICKTGLVSPSQQQEPQTAIQLTAAQSLLGTIFT